MFFLLSICIFWNGTNRKCICYSSFSWENFSASRRKQITHIFCSNFLFQLHKQHKTESVPHKILCFSFSWTHQIKVFPCSGGSFSQKFSRSPLSTLSAFEVVSQFSARVREDQVEHLMSTCVMDWLWNEPWFLLMSSSLWPMRKVRACN